MNRNHNCVTGVTRTGTGNFVSMAAAKTFYSGSHEEALKEGRIVVGKPVLAEGDWLQVERGRYIICSRPAPHSAP